MDGVWSRLKFEGGVHRVQRVPVTESQGRAPRPPAFWFLPGARRGRRVQIDKSDLRIDVYRSSGKGGQGVNTTDSAVRIRSLAIGDRGHMSEQSDPSCRTRLVRYRQVWRRDYRRSPKSRPVRRLRPTVPARFEPSTAANGSRTWLSGGSDRRSSGSISRPTTWIKSSTVIWTLCSELWRLLKSNQAATGMSRQHSLRQVINELSPC